MTSSNPSVAFVTGSVTVSEGRKFGNFAIETYFVTATTKVTISASFGGATKTKKLTVTP